MVQMMAVRIPRQLIAPAASYGLFMFRNRFLQGTHLREEYPQPGYEGVRGIFQPRTEILRQ